MRASRGVRSQGVRTFASSSVACRARFHCGAGGRDGHELAFRRRSTTSRWKNLGDAGFPDRILWMKAAAEKDPALDLSRVGIYGGSAGGQNAMGALLFHPEFYKVAVADCGCHDNRMDKIWWNEAWMGWPIGPEYAAQSNVTNASKLRGKLLLFVGELDRNVDPASTMQVVNALIQAKKDFDFVVFPGAGTVPVEGVTASAASEISLCGTCSRWNPPTAMENEPRGRHLPGRRLFQSWSSREGKRGGEAP